jgi:hypothetical protein
VKIFALFKKPGVKPSQEKLMTRSTLHSRSEDTSKKIDAIEYEMSAEFDASFSLAQQHSAQQQAQQLAEDNSFPHQIEEAAVLYASGQEHAAKALLQNLTTQETTSRFQEQLVWWMLFDLLQI